MKSLIELQSVDLLMDSCLKEISFIENEINDNSRLVAIQTKINQLQKNIDILNKALNQLNISIETNNSKILSLLTNLKGLKYFLKDSISNQKEIINFINYCKANQDSDGYIHQSFFNFSNMSKGIFMSGPFTNMFFKVIENQGNKIKILIGNMTTTITKNSNYLYRPV